MYRLSFVFGQDAAEGHANYKHHGNYAIMSWRTKSSHLLVQEFLVASVHFTSPIFVRTKRDKPLVPLTVTEQTLGSL